MKFTEHTAKPAVTPKIGRFATLRGRLHAEGSGAPSRGLVAWAARLPSAFCSASASAPPKRNLLSSSPTGEPARRGGRGRRRRGRLWRPVRVGLPAKGVSPSTVVKFDLRRLLSPPSPFGSGYYSGVAVNPTNGDVYLFGEEEALSGTPAMIFVYHPNTGALLSSFEVPAGAISKPSS